jgi:hypothetical protein
MTMATTAGITVCWIGRWNWSSASSRQAIAMAGATIAQLSGIRK